MGNEMEEKEGDEKEAPIGGGERFSSNKKVKRSQVQAARDGGRETVAEKLNVIGCFSFFSRQAKV